MSITFNELYTRITDQLSDSSSATTTLAKQLLNEAYKEALAIAGTEDNAKYYRFTIANNDTYSLPADLDKLRSIQLIEVETTGTTTGTTANKLVNSGASFGASLLGKIVGNTTDNTFARIINVDSPTQLSLDSDIFTSSEGYVIADGESNQGERVGSQIEWNEYKSPSVDETSDSLSNYFIQKPNIILYPTPSTNNNILVFNYLREVKDMSADDYTTGTISINKGSTTVTGSGTTFTASMIGRFIKSSSTWYKISGYTSSTILTLEKAWQEPSISGASYTIGEIPLISFKSAYTLTYRPIQILYLRRENINMAREYERLWNEAVKDLIKDSSSETDSIVIKLKGMPTVQLDSSKDKLITT